MKIIDKQKYKKSMARKLKALITAALVIMVAFDCYKFPLIILCIVFYKIDNDLFDLEVFTGYDNEILKKHGVKND